MLNRMKVWLSNYKYPLLLVAIILLVLYPFSLFLYIPKWDNINGYLPYRYFISDYLWNWHLPLWNPFQRYGYPAYADLQSGCWYPVVWMLMLFGKYTITSLIIELLLCFIIAALGFYKLSLFLFNSPKTAFILGLSYGLSGFMVGSTQLMVFLIGVAWLPWCVWAVLAFFKTLQYRYCVWAALFIAMQITGASPAFTIILVYLLGLLFLFKMVKLGLRSNHTIVLLKGAVSMTLLLILLMLPYLQSFYEFAPYFNRTDRLTYDGFLLNNPFGLPNYFSWVFPYTMISDSQWIDFCDISLRNAYIGITGLLAFVAALFHNINKRRRFFLLLLMVLVSLVLAFGDRSPFYKYAYHLPGFGIFRHPSFFRIYAMFAMLLLAGFVLKDRVQKNRFLRSDKWVMLSFFGLVVVALGVGLSTSTHSDIVKNGYDILHRTEFHTTSFASHIVINAAIIVVLMLVFYGFRKWLKLSVFTVLLWFTLFDVGIQTVLTAPTTMHFGFSYSSLKTFFNQLPNTINQAYNYTPFKTLDDTQGFKVVPGIWRNVAGFYKTISSVAENPMGFKNHDKAEADGTLNLIAENPLFYFPEKEYKPTMPIGKGYIWDVPTTVYIDTNATHAITAVKVDYNTFYATVENTSNSAQWLVLNQNYHHLWRAKLNNETLKVSNVNGMVMGVEVPAKSKGEIKFEYKSPLLIYTALISVLSYVLALVYLWVTRKRKAGMNPLLDVKSNLLDNE